MITDGVQLTCEHDGVEESREVVVEVQDSPHEEEGEVMETPAKKQPPSAGQELIDVT